MTERTTYQVSTSNGTFKYDTYAEAVARFRTAIINNERSAEVWEVTTSADGIGGSAMELCKYKATR